MRLISAGLTNHPNLPVEPLAFDEQAHGSIRKLVENALRDGRITPAQAPGWTLALANDLSREERRLAELPRLMHTEPVTAGFGSRRLDLSTRDLRSRQLSALLRGAMDQGLGYDSAWNKVKREHPALFAEMDNPS